MTNAICPVHGQKFVPIPEGWVAIAITTIGTMTIHYFLLRLLYTNFSLYRVFSGIDSNENVLSSCDKLLVDTLFLIFVNMSEAVTYRSTGSGDSFFCSSTISLWISSMQSRVHSVFVIFVSQR